MKTYEYQVVETVHQMTMEGEVGWRFCGELPIGRTVGAGFLMERVNEGPDAETLKMKEDLLHVIQILRTGHFEPELVVQALCKIAEGTYEYHK